MEFSNNKDQQSVQDLRIQYAECVQELEKTCALLDIEHNIGENSKIEVLRLEAEFTNVRNEYGKLNSVYNQKCDSRNTQG